jgi:hypothetical protein
MGPGGRGPARATDLDRPPIMRELEVTCGAARGGPRAARPGCPRPGAPVDGPAAQKLARSRAAASFKLPA